MLKKVIKLISVFSLIRKIKKNEKMGIRGFYSTFKCPFCGEMLKAKGEKDDDKIYFFCINSDCKGFGESRFTTTCSNYEIALWMNYYNGIINW